MTRMKKPKTISMRTFLARYKRSPFIDVNIRLPETKETFYLETRASSRGKFSVESYHPEARFTEQDLQFLPAGTHYRILKCIYSIATHTLTPVRGQLKVSYRLIRVEVYAQGVA